MINPRLDLLNCPSIRGLFPHSLLVRSVLTHGEEDGDHRTHLRSSDLTNLPVLVRESLSLTGQPLTRSLPDSALEAGPETLSRTNTSQRAAASKSFSGQEPVQAPGGCLSPQGCLACLVDSRYYLLGKWRSALASILCSSLMLRPAHETLV